MKKLLLSLMLAACAAGMNAETLADFAKGIGTFELYGTTTKDFVKINLDKNSVAGVKFANSYTKDGEFSGNYASVTCDGGFKAGDVVTVAGAYNNKDEKNSKVDFFTKSDNDYTVIFTTQQFVNGKLVEDNPVEETFTLDEDMDTLFFGRNGGTGTFVTTLKVVRGEETPDNPDPEDPDQSDALVLYKDGLKAGVFTMYGTCSMDESVRIQADANPVRGILFKNSYKSNDALAEHYVTVTCEGGFKQGDIVDIACVYNNKDEKETQIHVFSVDADKNITVLYETELCINGKYDPGAPALERFVLDGDYDMLYLGRKGGTSTYVINFTVTRPSAEKIPGDVNNDGEVNISDVVAVINQMAGTATYENADVNNDNAVDISDIVAIINIMAGASAE